MLLAQFVEPIHNLVSRGNTPLLTLELSAKLAILSHPLSQTTIVATGINLLGSHRQTVTHTLRPAQLGA